MGPLIKIALIDLKFVFLWLPQEGFQHTPRIIFDWLGLFVARNRTQIIPISDHISSTFIILGIWMGQKAKRRQRALDFYGKLSLRRTNISREMVLLRWINQDGTELWISANIRTNCAPQNKYCSNPWLFWWKLCECRFSLIYLIYTWVIIKKWQPILSLFLIIRQIKGKEIVNDHMKKFFCGKFRRNFLCSFLSSMNSFRSKRLLQKCSNWTKDVDFFGSKASNLLFKIKMLCNLKHWETLFMLLPAATCMQQFVFIRLWKVRAN